ncbi:MULTISPECIES: hypothetical protein [Bacillus]|uniref:hypothetical protein n=1 Tax=Bacillus TaxID=1386 RepID=UPI000A56D510|nr:hypothetical protein [Bacillus mobilis]
MKKKHTTMFLLFFVASIIGGLSLKNTVDYSMVVGVGLGIVFLLCSAFCAGKSS